MIVSSWFILLQAAAVPPSFDLAKLKAPDDCAPRNGGEILVCGRQPPVQDRVASGPTTEEAMPRAELGLFGSVRGSLHGEAASVGGFTSNRMMVTVTAPF